MKFWINLSTVYPLTCSYYTLQFIQSTYDFFLKGTVCPYFVVLSTIGCIAFFDSNIACNYHVGWCDITIQFAAFTPYILPFFVFVWEAHYTTYFVVLLVHSLFLFQYSLPLSRGLMWYHVNPHFCYYVIHIIIKKCYHFFFIS